jgi:hypothetical protein
MQVLYVLSARTLAHSLELEAHNTARDASPLSPEMYDR